MFRNLSRIRLRPGLDWSRKAEANEFSHSSVAAKLDSVQTFALLNADFQCKIMEESTVRSFVCSIGNALHLGDRSRASSLLLGLAATTRILKAHDFESILELCVKYHDPLFAMETWGVLEDKKINANEACYIFTMRSLCKGGYFKEAFDILSIAGENCDLMLLPIYNDFLNSCLKLQNLHYANLCLDMMERQAVGKNEITFVVLLKLAVLQKNLSAVHEIWKEYVKYYNPTILSLRFFIWAFSSLKDLESARERLQYMVTLALQNNIHVTLSTKGRMSSTRPDIPIPSRNELRLQSFVIDNHKSSDGSLIESCNIDSKTHSRVSCHGAVKGEIKNIHAKTILRRSFAEVIFACVHSQDCIAAEELMVQMKALGLKPSKVTYDAFIKAVSSGGGYECGLKMLKEMQMNKVYPCETSLASLSVSCSKALKLDLAKDLLDKVPGNVGVLPFNAFLAACVALDKPEIAVRVLSRMKKMEVQFDMQTYELLFSLFGLVNAPYEEGNMLSREEATKRIKAIELDMAKNGLQHSFTTMKNLLSALGTEGQKSELVQYLHVAEKLFDPMDSKRRATLHNIVLQSLVELKESSMAINIFKNMRRRGFLPDTATYSIMIECCSVTECFRSALQLLSLMLRDGYYPTTVTYTSLMKVVKDNEHFYEELNLLDRASTEECDPLQRSVGDAVMYNTVLLKARDKGRIDIIEFLLEKMHQDKIQPNPVTCSIVLDAYTNQGYINTALESLQVLSLRMISEDKEELQKHQPEIEELILSQSPEAESQILQHFDSDVNFATALLNLRWCSLIGFSTPWSPDETSWAKTLSANFKSAFGA
ncbi:unnamed protein product [Rhodiola kirilowii]